jgi:proline dehydrogenase
MNISFENTKIAFSDKSKKELIKAFWLFKTVESPLVVRIGEKLLKFALFVKFPVKWIIKPTIFSHFCGGETMEECKQTITRLSKSNIKTILDYSAEGIKNESSFDNVKRQIIEIIELAKNEINIPFAVFKVTGIARFDLLEKVSNKSKLNTSEFEEFERVKNRIDEICAKGFENDIPILIDAEESWIQDAIEIGRASCRERVY